MPTDSKTALNHAAPDSDAFAALVYKAKVDILVAALREAGRLEEANLVAEMDREIERLATALQAALRDVATGEDEIANLLKANQRDAASIAQKSAEIERLEKERDSAITEGWRAAHDCILYAQANSYGPDKDGVFKERPLSAYDLATVLRTSAPGDYLPAEWRTAGEDAPGHTDLMVAPETIDAFMEANPLPSDPHQARIDALEEAAKVAESGKTWPDIAAAIRKLKETGRG